MRIIYHDPEIINLNKELNWNKKAIQERQLNFINTK